METMLVVIIGLLVGVIITHLFQNTIKKDHQLLSQICKLILLQMILII